MIQEGRNQKEENIDIKQIIFRYSQYWYYFILSIVFCVFIAFLSNRYTVPTYSVSTTLLIRDDNNTQLGAENLLEGLELFSGKKNLKNEIIILNSFTLNEKVVEDLNLGVSYFQHGFLKTNELYTNAPFIVNVDSSHLQLAGVYFILSIVSEDEFKLSIKAKDHYPYNINEDKLHKKSIANVDINKKYKFNTPIENEFFKFTINRNPYFDFRNISENEKSYSFKLHHKSKLVNKFIKSLNINPINKESSILKLNIKAKMPKKNTEYLDKLTELYIQGGLDEKNLMAINTIDFIKDQLEIIHDSLDVIKNKIEIFEKQNPGLRIADKEFGTYFQKQKLDNTLYEQRVHIKYYKSLVKYLQESKESSNILSPTTMGIANPELNILISKLLELYTKKRELQLTTTEKNPTYQALLAQISHIKQSIIENVTNLISSAKIYENELVSRINTLNNTINQLPEAQKNFVVLKRKYQLYDETEKYLQKGKYDASIAKAGTESDHKVIDLARIDNNKPTAPKKNLSYFLAILFGFIIPGSFFALRDFFSETVRGKIDLQNNTEIPILGLLGHNDAAKNLFVHSNPKSVITESFRSLRTNIQYLAANKQKKIITVTSSVGGEGKTFCAMNLAAIFALSGHKTILIGGDLRKPKLQEDFKINNNLGLSNYLINKASLKQIINNSEIEALDIILSGPTPPNPAELLDSTRMLDLVSTLNKEYDFVIIDTPPIGLVTDGVILMKNADINLYVVRHNYTKIKTLGIVNNLYQQQLKNINIIINDYQYTKSSYGYGYGYGYATDGYGYYENEK